MNSFTPFLQPHLQLSISPPPFATPHYRKRPCHSFHTTTTILSLSFSSRRRRRRPHRRYPNLNDSSNSTCPDSGKLQFILDVEQLKTTPPVSLLHRTLSYFEYKLKEFVSSGNEAYQDLRNLVIIEPGSNRVLVSCKSSTVRFVGGVMIWSLVVIVVVRVLVKLGLGFKGGVGGGRVEMVRRRDRSLGGREVVVATGVGEVRERSSDVFKGNKGVKRYSMRRDERKLPSWWPHHLVHTPVVEESYKDEYQRQAHRLVQAIMDGKLSGKDVSEDDILDLRRICRKSGIRLSFPTENAQQSLYRSSVHYVISTCSRARTPFVQIDGEDVRLFVAGLAYNFGLTTSRAATIVCAAVAAQTRLWFLQAWALEMQGKHTEATDELKKICVIHQVFPPEPSSPEMEMVARGLQKYLKPDQREFLLNKLVSICGEESRRSAGEALGLV